MHIMSTNNIAASLVCAYRSCFYFIFKLQKKHIQIHWNQHRTWIRLWKWQIRVCVTVLVLQWILQPWPPVLPKVSIRRVCWFKQPTYSHTDNITVINVRCFPMATISWTFSNRACVQRWSDVLHDDVSVQPTAIQTSVRYHRLINFS